jgi:hypothetical protein
MTPNGSIAGPTACPVRAKPGDGDPGLLRFTKLYMYLIINVIYATSLLILFVLVAGFICFYF